MEQYNIYTYELECVNDQTSFPNKLVKAVKIDIKNIPTTTHEPSVEVEWVVIQVISRQSILLATY